jgi:hypothetical protein
MAEKAQPAEESSEFYGIIEGSPESTVLDEEELRLLDNDVLFIMVMSGSEPAIREHSRRFRENRAAQKKSGTSSEQESAQ